MKNIMKVFECKNCGHQYEEEDVLLSDGGWYSYWACPNCDADHEEFGALILQVEEEE